MATPAVPPAGPADAAGPPPPSEKHRGYVEPDGLREPARGGADLGLSQRSPASAVVRRSRISGTWVAVIVATVVLIFLLVFILQNLDNVTVSFLGFSGTLPLGVAMLFGAVAGALLVALVGMARILQLRRRVRHIDPQPGPARPAQG